MLERIRPQLTYANVVATLALFLVVAGGGALAASKLKRNSVKSKHIAPEAVKGVDAAESTFGKVPSAGTADTATTASSADSVAPGSVGPSALADSIRAKRLRYDAFESALGFPQTLASMGEFDVLASCTTSGTSGAGRTHLHVQIEPEVEATAMVGGASDTGGGGTEAVLGAQTGLPEGVATDVINYFPDTDTATAQMQVSAIYESDSSTAVLELRVFAVDTAGTSGGSCEVHGVAVPGT